MKSILLQLLLVITFLTACDWRKRLDRDNDGFLASEDDCDDNDEAIHPDADERCDGLDNDCDGRTDIGALDAVTVYVDADGDGYGDDSTAESACEVHSGTVQQGGDCDDNADDVYPGAIERCNQLDDDCDGTVNDESPNYAGWWLDADRDGYGDPAFYRETCDDATQGWINIPLDCDDANIRINPSADELCDGVDNDCDGAVDQFQDSAVTGYADADSDGYGDLATPSYTCPLPPGFVTDDRDCNDHSSAFHPGALEADCADPNDYNCDGFVGEQDFDGDGFDACQECDDASGEINPAAVESCDGVDNDCDGTTDEGGAVDASIWYADLDGDGFGDPLAPTPACTQPSRHVSDATDCDDGYANVNPNGVDDLCDTVDADCSGQDGDLAVDDDGATYPSAYDSVQAAIDDAIGGELVCVAPGRYLENITVLNMELQLVALSCDGGAPMAADCREDTELDGGGQGTVVTFDDELGAGLITDASRLSGFTVLNGLGASAGGVTLHQAAPQLDQLIVTGNTANNGSGDAFGGGLSAIDADLDVSNTVFANNSATVSAGGALATAGGGGLYQFSANGTHSLRLDNVSFEDNSAVNGDGTARGGGLYVTDLTAANLTEVSFSRNLVAGSSATGGGAYLLSAAASGTYTFDGCTFGENTAGAPGAGAYVTTAGGGTQLDVAFSATQFNDNRSTSDTTGCGAALYVGRSQSTDAVDLSVEASSFDTNTYLPGSSGYSGQAGALCFVGDTLDIADTSFADNAAQSSGNGGGGALRVTATSGASLDGLIFSGNSELTSGGALSYLSGSGPATLSNSSFEGNSAADSGSAIAAFAPMTIRDTTFTDNQVSGTSEGGHGGALLLSDASADFVLENLTFTGNESSAYGGAILIYGAGSAILTSCVFDSNHAVMTGGAIYAYHDGALTLDGSHFTSNVSDFIGGAVGTQGPGPLTVSDCVFESNLAGSSAAILAYTDLTVTDSAFTSNASSTGGRGDVGGAIVLNIYNQQIPDLTLSGSSFDDNVNVGNGAVFWEVADVVSISDTSFTNNTAGYRGAAIYGVTTTSVTMSGVTVTGNQTVGAGAYGAAVHIGNTDSVDIDDCAFVLNESSVYGALALESTETITIEDTEFLDNTSLLSSSGALGLSGVYSGTQSATLRNVAFIGNTATVGSGGALLVADSLGDADIAVDITNAIFADNAAYSRGGAIFLEDRATVVLTNVTMFDNSAGESGGAIYMGDSAANPSYATLLNVSLEDNTCAYAAGCGPAVYLQWGTVTTSYSHAYGNTDPSGSLQFGSYLGDFSDASFAAGTGNLVGSAPMFTDTSSADPSLWDLTLLTGSPLIDAGDPSLYDADGTRSDIGAYGGPLSASW